VVRGNFFLEWANIAEYGRTRARQRPSSASADWLPMGGGCVGDQPQHVACNQTMRATKQLTPDPFVI